MGGDQIINWVVNPRIHQIGQTDDGKTILIKSVYRIKTNLDKGDVQQAGRWNQNKQMESEWYSGTERPY